MCRARGRGASSVRQIRLSLDALELFETVTEARVFRHVLALTSASPGRKVSAGDVAKASGLDEKTVKRGLAAAVANGTLRERILDGKKILRTYEPGPKLAGKIWGQSAPESDNESTAKRAENPGSKRPQTYQIQGQSDPKIEHSGSECPQNSGGIVSPESAAPEVAQSGTPVALIGTSHEESIKPSLPPIVPPQQNGARPRTKRQRDREAAAERKAERLKASAERREREAREKQERAEARAAQKRARDEAKAKAAADTIDIGAEPVDVQIVYRKIREAIGCKTVSPSDAQQVAAVRFARELVAPDDDGERPAATLRCEQLEDWKADWWAGRFAKAGEQITKPYVGDLRNTFETSIQMRESGSLAVARAPERRPNNATDRDAANLRAQKALLSGASYRGDSDPDATRFSAPRR